MTNKPYFLALNRIPTIGPRTIMAMLKQWPNLKEMFQLSSKHLEAAGLSSKMAEAISHFSMTTIEADLRWEAADNHHLLTWEESAYPALLKEIHDPPVVLYAAGRLDCLEPPALAMIGTRKPSIPGQETARDFAFELAKNNITIVSGLATGIDRQAHEGCLAAVGKTIAVMGTGIDRIYPAAHSALAQQICENGLLLTEFPLKTAPMAGHFPRRNRIISGLSLATLVVEAAIRSGSLITARLALEQNRDVLAIPGSIHNPQARGCHYLVQQGAKLVTSLEDILEELSIKKTIPDRGITRSLATHNKNLVKCIGFEVTAIDLILKRSGLTLDEVMNELAMLEIEGLIQASPGGYIRCMASVDSTENN